MINKGAKCRASGVASGEAELSCAKGLPVGPDGVKMLMNAAPRAANQSSSLEAPPSAGRGRLGSEAPSPQVVEGANEDARSSSDQESLPAAPGWGRWGGAALTPTWKAPSFSCRVTALLTKLLKESEALSNDSGASGMNWMSRAFW